MQKGEMERKQQKCIAYKKLPGDENEAEQKCGCFLLY